MITIILSLFLSVAHADSDRDWQSASYVVHGPCEKIFLNNPTSMHAYRIGVVNGQNIYKRGHCYSTEDEFVNRNWKDEAIRVEE